MFLKLKMLLGIFSSSLMLSSSVTALESVYWTSDEKQTLLNQIKDEIQHNSNFSREEDTYSYNGETYHDKNSILDKLLLNNPIQKIRTTSNPNKIIKDYSTGILDGNQIYSTDFSDYVKVYKNALGKVVLPTCVTSVAQPGCEVSSESQLNRAIDSYANHGLGTAQYTYEFGDANHVKWYDSEELAKTALQNTNYTVKSSLFYYINGMYYNAFNLADLEVLKSNGTLTPTYYYTGGLANTTENTESVSTNSDIVNFWASRDDFKTELSERMYELMINNNLTDEVFSTDGSWKLNLKPDTGNGDFLSVTINALGVSLSEDKNSIIFDSDARDKYQISPKNLIETLRNHNNWVGDGEESWENENYHYTATIPFKDDASIVIKLDTSADDSGIGYHYANLSYLESNLTATPIDKKDEKSTEDVLTYGLNKNSLSNVFANVFANLNLSENLSENALNDINNSFINSLAMAPDAADDIILKYGKISNWNTPMIKALFMQYFNKAISQIFANISDYDDFDLGWMKSDYSYGGGNGLGFSLADSENYFKTQILAKYLTQNSSDNLEIPQIDSHANSFQTSVDNWTNNFYYLSSTSQQALPLLQMFYIDSKELTNISEFSGVNSNSVIATSKKAAKDMQLENDDPILREQFNVYNINGTLIAQGDNSQEVFEKLRKKISLEYKFISLDELKNYQDQDVDWEDVVSDGDYYVYTFKNNQNQQFYFKSYTEALDMYLNSLVENIKIEKTTKIIYNYAYVSHGELINREWSSQNDIDQIANEIYTNLEGVQ